MADATLQAQCARLLRALRWALVLCSATGHTKYARAITKTLIDLQVRVCASAPATRAQVWLQVSMTAGDATACAASMFVDTGGAKFVAADLFVELTIASVKKLMGKPRGPQNVEFLARLSCAAGVLDSLRSSQAAQSFLGEKQRGRNTGVRSKFKEMLNQAPNIVDRHQLVLFSLAPHAGGSKAPLAAPRGFGSPNEPFDSASRVVRTTLRHLRTGCNGESLQPKSQQQTKKKKDASKTVVIVDNDVDDNDNDDNDNDDDDDDDHGGERYLGKRVRRERADDVDDEFDDSDGED